MPAISPKRKYNSTRRKTQAQQTRMQIIEAARILFIEYGYTGASIEAIAKQANVAPETVFAIFGNKRTILMNLVAISVGGDDQPIPLMKRPGPQAVLQETNPNTQLRLFAHDIANILERVAPVMEILHCAAKYEPEIADLLKNLLEERLQNLTMFVHNLSSHNPIRDDFDERRAGEIVWAITSPEVFRLLTIDRKWSIEDYSHWLGDTLIRLLIP
jgi:AcrR family transcriptional regulator